MALAFANRLRFLLPSRSLHTSSQSDRWHQDKVENRKICRWGYEDKVKRRGALPRLTNEAPRVRQMRSHDAVNPFAPSRAIEGQNDYIDILGSDDIHPMQVQYGIPNWLKNSRIRHMDLLIAIQKKKVYGQSAMEEVKPLAWKRITEDHRRRLKESNEKMNQKHWINYSGLKFGPTKDHFKTKYPF